MRRCMHAVVMPVLLVWAWLVVLPASALYVLDSGSHPPVSKPALGHPDGAGDFPLDDQAGLNEALVREVIRLRQDQYKIMQELNFLRDQQDQMIKSAPSLFQLQNILAQLSIGFPSTAQGGALQQQAKASARPTDVEVDDKKGAGADASRLEAGRCADARLADGSKLNIASVDCESDGRVGLESGAAKMESSDNARSLHPSPADGRAEEYDYLGGMSSEPSVDTVEATLNMTSPVSGPFLPEVDTPDGETQCGEPASVSSLSVFLVETGIQLAENLQSMMGDDCPIVIFDFTYNMPVIRNTNMAFLDLFGYTQDQVAKMKWRMFICPQYLERTVQILKQARSQKDTFIQFTQVYTNVYFKNFLALDTHVLLSTQRGGLVDLVIIQPDKSLPCPSIGDRCFRSFKVPLPSRLEGSEVVKSDAEQSQQYARTMLSATLNIASMASRAARGIDVDPSGREEGSTELPERWKSASGERQMKEGDRAEGAPGCAGDAISNPAYERLHPRGDDRGIHPSASDLVNREKDRAIEQKRAQNAASEGSSSPYYHSYQHGLGFPSAPSEKKAYPVDADQSSKFPARDFAPKTILPSSDYSSLDHHQFYAPSHPFASNHLQTTELCTHEPQSQHAEPLGSSVSQKPRLELSELHSSHRPSSSSPLHRASLPSHAPPLASSLHFFQDCKQRHYSDPLLPRPPHPYEDPLFFTDFGDDSSRFYNK
ncbi:uncharacterized protein LOC126326508 [Schistocerca gregaria]|uniref:uncharacterized protein LOC126326508 n=1 Tax=Schistocerca gregaria TaxID=7010 RepID=UPI00211F3B75|nr:uncharacterized protein LOC126326508 [Schistocerca gregaria]